MKITLKITLVLVFVLLGITAFSQTKGYQRITEKRVEFIAPRLNLTSEEAQQFWPLFHEFHNEREKLSQDSKIKNKQGEKKNPDTEEEFLNAVTFMIDSKMNQAILLKEFNQKYLNVLPANKVYKLYRLDEEFNRKLLKQIKDAGKRGR